MAVKSENSRFYITISKSLKERIESCSKEQGYSSLSSFFTALAIEYLQNHETDPIIETTDGPVTFWPERHIDVLKYLDGKKFELNVTDNNKTITFSPIIAPISTKEEPKSN